MVALNVKRVTPFQNDGDRHLHMQPMEFRQVSGSSLKLEDANVSAPWAWF
jgi:hypothetical protein